MAMSSGGNDGEVTPEMNTTPLIDVMLVLLVMFIITIPIQTHAVKINLPVNNPNPPPQTIKPDFNTVSVNLQNSVTWNGAPIDLATPPHVSRPDQDHDTGTRAAHPARSLFALCQGRRDAGGRGSGRK